jgi:hypothetical protein
MKQKIYYLGIISVMILMAGIMFKVNHWPASGILLCMGTVLLVAVFLPSALINNYRVNGNKQNKLLYIVTYVTSFIVFIAMLFKILHWPYAGYLLFIAIPFPFVIFLPVWLYVTSKIKNFDINNTIYVLFLLALHSILLVLLTLNVTRETLDNTMKLDALLISLNEKIKGFQTFEDKSSIGRTGDEVLIQIEECRKLLYNRAVLSAENIKAGSYETRYLTDVDIPADLLLTSSHPSPAMKLNTALNNYITELGKVPGNQNIEKLANDFFELNEIPGDETPWTLKMFLTKYLTWYLVDLDAMENFVRLVKQEVIN